ncbi:MAG: winged helix-turn-helix transcriptional regulator, partial [Lachnospiraceae bacterium]|nr:winged helix-turn-helix transcriptional regulator [Lachnospiraceae bacterium]
MLTYSFEKKGSESLYEYLYKLIKADILSGKIAAGEKLPSKRALAKHLSISTITVENTYSQLCAEGYLFSVPKSGFFVS